MRSPVVALHRLLVRLAAGARAGSLLAELDDETTTSARGPARRLRAWYCAECRSLALWYGRRRFAASHAHKPLSAIPREHEMSSFDRARTDFMQATRVLRSSPGFAALVVATLAVGIGLSVAMASIIDTVLVRPLDVVEPDRLIRIWARDTESGAQHLDATVSDFEDYRQRADALASLTALSVTRTGLADHTGRPTNVTVGRVMGDWTATVGTRPALGRSFTAQEQADGGQVAMLAYRYWQERHGGSPDIVGSTVRLDDVPYEIIGVLPATWAYPRAVQVWRPFDRGELAYRDDDRELVVLARMRHDTEVAAVSSELERLSAVARQERPQENENIEAWAEPMHAELVRDVETPLLMLAGAVAVVLLITCANTAGLMLARGSAREHEMAIRGALGAGRRDLVRQVLIESLLLAALGGALGVVAAAVALDVIVAVAPAELPFAAAIGVDGRTVVVAVAITLLTGVAFGLLPAWRAAVGTGTLRAGTRTSARVTGGQRALVVVELALAVVLAVGGGLLLRSVDQLLRVERGFEPERVLAVGVGMPDALHGENPLLLYDRVQAAVASLPGVEAVAYGRTHPLDPYGLNFRVLGARGFPTTEASAPGAVVRMVSPGYFRTAAIPLLAGRSFRDEDDGDSRRVAIVTESFGQAFYGAASPVGETFEIPWGEEARVIEIVGVVGDVVAEIGVPPRPALYLPFAQFADHRAQLIVRTAVPPVDLVASTREAVWRVHPALTLDRPTTMRQLLGEQTASERFQSGLVTAFAVVALALTSLGIYGVISLGVTRRRRELGIRQALGADRSRVRRLVLRETLWLVAPGLLGGLAAAYAVSSLLRSLLYEVAPGDPIALGAVTLLVVLVALAAAWSPTRRATKVDPVLALRAD